MTMKLDTAELQNMLEAISKKGLDVKAAAEEALTATSDLIAENLKTAASPYAGRGRKGYATGRMYSTITNGGVEWDGSTATVRAGFKIKDALESIFIMYGTPRIAKDQKVYNAIMGTKVKKEIKERQEEILLEYMGLSNGR